MRKLRGLGVVTLWWASGCGAPSAQTTRGDAVNVSAYERVTACSDEPSRLIGTLPEGQACTRAELCAPTCCQCQTGAHTLVWMGATCAVENGGACADPEEVCEATNVWGDSCLP